MKEFDKILVRSLFKLLVKLNHFLMKKSDSNQNHSFSQQQNLILVDIMYSF